MQSRALFYELTLHGWNGEGPPSLVRQNWSLRNPHPAILTLSTSFAASKVNLIMIKSNIINKHIYNESNLKLKLIEHISSLPSWKWNAYRFCFSLYNRNNSIQTEYCNVVIRRFIIGIELRMYVDGLKSIYNKLWWEYKMEIKGLLCNKTQQFFILLPPL